jgi:hypothetical protein
MRRIGSANKHTLRAKNNTLIPQKDFDGVEKLRTMVIHERNDN